MLTASNEPTIKVARPMLGTVDGDEKSLRSSCNVDRFDGVIDVASLQYVSLKTNTLCDTPDALTSRFLAANECVIDLQAVRPGTTHKPQFLYQYSRTAGHQF